MTTRGGVKALAEREATSVRPMGQRYVARIAFRVLVDGKTVEVRAGEVLSAAILNACAGKLDKLQGARFIRTEFVEL